ncbi:MAG: hypothetical protein M1824_004675 [Vezdaea acicularis]|nr:MAG: hypothetical protein M1824_004675 [Vezdaea acicularis]
MADGPPLPLNFRGLYPAPPLGFQGTVTMTTTHSSHRGIVRTSYMYDGSSWAPAESWSELTTCASPYHAQDVTDRTASHVWRLPLPGVRPVGFHHDPSFALVEPLAEPDPWGPLPRPPNPSTIDVARLWLTPGQLQSARRRDREWEQQRELQREQERGRERALANAERQMFLVREKAVLEATIQRLTAEIAAREGVADRRGVEEGYGDAEAMLGVEVKMEDEEVGVERRWFEEGDGGAELVVEEAEVKLENEEDEDNEEMERMWEIARDTTNNFLKQEGLE